MDKEFKQLAKEAKKLQLNQEDKVSVREKIYKFVKQNPIPEIQSIPLTALLKRYSTVFAALIIVIGTVTTSFAAEGSVPGNTLYPIKQINEKFISSLMFTERAKIQWGMRKVERRLEEAEKLAARESLNADWIIYLEKDFEERATMIHAKIAKLELENRVADAAEFNSHFETSLRAHGQILTKIIKSKQDPESIIEPLVLNIRAKSNMATRARIKTEDTILSESMPMGGGGEEAPMVLAIEELDSTDSVAITELDLAVKERLENTEERIKRIREMLQTDQVSEETSSKIEERLDWAEELIRQGEKHLEDGVISKSFLLAQQANRIAQEIEILIGRHLDLFKNVDIKQGTISIKDCKYPILESYPRQCATPDGNLVIEEDLEIEIPR